MAGFQPSKQRQIVSELAALQSRECGMKRRQTDTAAELDSRHDLLKAVKPERRLDKVYVSNQQRLAGAAGGGKGKCRRKNEEPSKCGMRIGELQSPSPRPSPPR